MTLTPYPPQWRGLKLKEMKLSKHQIEVLTILYNGGIITRFDDGDTYLKNDNGDLFPFRITTFRKLLSHELIVFSYAPAIGVECYGNTNKANELLHQQGSHTKMED